MRRKEVLGVLGVELAPGLEESTTPYAGVSLLIELMRRCGVDTVSNRVPAAKKGLSARSSTRISPAARSSASTGRARRFHRA